MSPKKRNNTGARDPFQEREARRYANPIPSREFILTVLTEHGAPLVFEEIAERLKLREEEQQNALRNRLSAMGRDGQLLRNRRGGYCPVNRQDLIAGRVIGHPDGFGFLRPDEGGDDLFLSPREMRSVWHDDRVLATVTGMDRRGRREGAVVEILERAHTQMVGRLRIEGGVAFLVPDNKRLHHELILSQDGLAEARDGQMVVAAIVEQPSAWRQPIGRLIEVIGDKMAAGMATEVAIRTHEIPAQWPDPVSADISGLSPEVPESAKQGRKDLRDLPLVTIDGADARDFDDAVFCRRTPKGWRLYVCIADVSAYVAPDTALDEEAQKRGNSVYFPDRVVPMLPEILSNGLCSLNPLVDRLCLTAELLIDDAGEIQRSTFYPAVMRSHARLTYDQVGAILTGDADLGQRFSALLPHLEELYALFRAMRTGREGRGAIDFDTTETRFRFDAEGRVLEVVPVLRHDAHKLIEECMLAANVAAARLFERRKMPALYRIHEPPGMEKLTDLRDFLGELGLRLGGGLKPNAKDYAKLLDRIQGRADAHMIQTVLLRSMMQAQYAADNLGHFGLNYPAYTHFTSPIRRYPDLIVHRAIKHLVADGKPHEFEYPKAELARLGEHCSMTERRADEATRDVEDVLKCEFMADKIGQTFAGIITGVNSFGIFVELEGVYVTGLVHVTNLDYDYFHFDPVGHRLSGERTGKVYRLGDPVRVQLAAVNVEDRKIDLMLADKVRKGQEPRSSKGRGGGKPADKDRGGDKPAAKGKARGKRRRTRK